VAVGHAVLADRVFDGHGWRTEAAVLFRDGRIIGLGSWGEVPPDWPQTRLPVGAFLAPGFIDLQVNGGGGVLLNAHPTTGAMRAIARAHRRYGTPACLPTLIPDTRERVRTAIAAARAIAGRDGVLGLHLEGPFISPLRPGVHRSDRIAKPGEGDLEELCELAEAGTSLVTLAPECVPVGFVRTLASSGVRISIGHSEAPAAVRSDGVLGLHLEGPFISPLRPGVHRSDRIAKPGEGDLEELCELAEAGTSLVTLAPECVPVGFVRTLASSGVRISIGHSEAPAAV